MADKTNLKHIRRYIKKHQRNYTQVALRQQLIDRGIDSGSVDQVIAGGDDSETFGAAKAFFGIACAGVILLNMLVYRYETNLLPYFLAGEAFLLSGFGLMEGENTERPTGRNMGCG